jgi:hypothetical protein
VTPASEYWIDRSGPLSALCGRSHILLIRVSVAYSERIVALDRKAKSLPVCPKPYELKRPS